MCPRRVAAPCGADPACPSVRVRPRVSLRTGPAPCPPVRGRTRVPGSGGGPVSHRPYEAACSPVRGRPRFPPSGWTPCPPLPRGRHRVPSWGGGGPVFTPPGAAPCSPGRRRPCAVAPSARGRPAVSQHTVRGRPRACPPSAGADPCPPVRGRHPVPPSYICWGGPAESFRQEAAPSPPLRGRCPCTGACHPFRGGSRVPPSAGSVPLTSSVRGRQWLGRVCTKPPPFGCSNSALPPSILPCYPPSGGFSPLHPPDWGRHRMCLADWRPPARSHPLVSRGSACKAPPYIVAGGRKARPGTEVLKSRG